VFTACGIMHRRCYSIVGALYQSWGWAKLSPETCWADWSY